jgi:acetoin utilization protein AcuB
MNTTAIMTRDVVVISPSVSASAAVRLMNRLKIRHLPVVEGLRLVGILSDRDLLKHGNGVTCAEAMTPTPVTCSPGSSVGRVAQLMLEHKIDSIPIVSPSGALTGLVTSTDLLGLLVDREQAQVLPFDFHLRVARSEGEAHALAA